jgi:hypothetical protein
VRLDWAFRRRKKEMLAIKCYHRKSEVGGRIRLKSKAVSKVVFYPVATQMLDSDYVMLRTTRLKEHRCRSVVAKKGR